MRTIEAVVLLLVATIAVCYFIEIFVLPQTQPSFLEMGGALVTPSFRHAGMIYVAIGIIGATVMPHNLYLHSALVQSRRLQKDESSMRPPFASTPSIPSWPSPRVLCQCRHPGAGSHGVFRQRERDCGGRPGRSLQPRQRLDPRRLPDPGAVAGNHAGQHLVRHRPAGQRPEQHHHRHAGRPGGDGRLHALAHHSRGSAGSSPARLAILPAIIIIGIRGDSSVTDLLILSQVVLALQLPFAMFPLLHFTGSRERMGAWRNGWFLLSRAGPAQS